MPLNIELFSEIGLLVVIAALFSFLTRLLRQPLIIGYIATGLFVGPLFLNLIRSHDTIQLFGEIGISFLLFIVGLSLTPYVIKEFGKISLITGLGQVLITSLVGYFICLALGFSGLTSLYISAALAFSSTIIILKLISDKGDLEKLYAKISIGFLLVQDLIVIFLLFMIPLFAAGKGSPIEAGLMSLKGAAAIIIIFFISFIFLPKLNRFLSSSQELLFIFSIAWGIGLAALFKNIGFSLESGALIAGVALSALPSRHEISSRLIPLRDFFIILFFVFLGSQMIVSNLQQILIPALVLSALVLIGNPLILMIIMGIMGYRKKTSFQTGLTVAQISEFSLILIALGVKFGHLKPEILSLVTLVGLITISGSTYFIIYSEKIFNAISGYLGAFERKKIFEKEKRQKSYQFVLFGYNRIGFDFLELFKNTREGYLVIDYDPKVIDQLGRAGANSEYGDASDVCFLESINLQKIKMAVSTIPVLETNILILKQIKRQNPTAITMLVAHNIRDAIILYDKGADYVILPHFLGGQYASLLAKNLNFDRIRFKKLRQRHIAHLNLRESLDQNHPTIKRYL
ncbi:MAG: cation:proton antiporter [bacterium]|nr:cation:proton antiporter [bacterium]